MNIEVLDTGTTDDGQDQRLADSGLIALERIASSYRVQTSPAELRHELALTGPASSANLLHAAKQKLNMKARQIEGVSARRLATLPCPAIACLTNGDFCLLRRADEEGFYQLFDPSGHGYRTLPADLVIQATAGRLILVQRRPDMPGVERKSFGFGWFLSSIYRYRGPLSHVLIASFFVQIFALVTPLFFQNVIDKVLGHEAYSTLYLLTFGMAVLALFDVLLQYLRTYALSHTSNRIDVELGTQLFDRLLRLPLSYFETRPTGQTVARVRELDTIREFLTGQGLFSAIDLLFTFVFIAVLFAYSTTLAWIVVASIPCYVLVAILIVPPLRRRIDAQFNAGAYSQQFLVETVVGAQALKAAAVEPVTQKEWGERLAGYVNAGFNTTMLAAVGQNAIQLISKLMKAALLLFGAQAVIDGELTVGAFIAFNMIADQVVQPILRLSQLWQDFQQVRISVDRLGDILNEPPEPRPERPMALPRPRGNIALRNVSFRYHPNTPDALKEISLEIAPGEVIGIVGPSGSGKSTLTKLIQRFYSPGSGQVLIDGQDIAHVDPAWLRSQVGSVLQENWLFNKPIHDNIALANPAMNRAEVVEIARLAGAEEFIDKLPGGYDTMIEERGANLSGGQRQRLAIARALAPDPPILIFDEATSALDYESERIIQHNMREITKGRTVLIIAHRLAAVRHCDRIVGMEDGRIVEIGTHDELLARSDGLYARLWALQTDRDAASSGTGANA